MTYRLATSLELLRDEVTARFPDRDTTSDGWIGDPARASRSSDHNAWVKDGRGIGIVRAFDFDSGHGTDTSAGRLLTDCLIRLARTGHPALGRGAYLISDRRIASASGGWTWRGYSGSNPHIAHMHVSVSLDPAATTRASRGGSPTRHRARHGPSSGRARRASQAGSFSRY